MNPTKILYVASASDLFLKIPPLSTHVKELSEATSASPDYDVRMLLPRFGVINERTSNIHETIRLSGINISMNKYRISLVVKVPSVRGVKTPIYFVDNEELFKKKSDLKDFGYDNLVKDKKGNFYEDNHIRAIFFCKSVLSIIEELGWIPHVIHCHGWMSSLIPLYLKKSYTTSSPLQHTKSIYTLYEDTFSQSFPEETLKHLRFKQLKNSDAQETFPGKIDYSTFTKVAMAHADKVTRTFESSSDPIWKESSSSSPIYKDALYIPCNEEAKEKYFSFYQDLQPR